MNFDWFMPVRIYSGAGCLTRGGEALRALGKRCLIVTGARSAKVCGALDDALGTLRRAGIEATVFPGIGPNPLLSQCHAAAYTAETCRADFLLGIGGGSVMDATKAAAWLAANTVGDPRQIYKGLRHPPLPVALVGTSAGTGSEVTGTAVLTVDADGRKKSINGPQCYARLAFADPRYTDSLSRTSTVSTALDALAHTVEGYLNPACGDIPTLCAEKAFPLLTGGLQWLAENDGLPDAALRDALYYGSLWAGLVLNACGTAFPHPFSYILTEEYQIPHGMGCAVFLPALAARAERLVPDRAARMLALCGGRESFYGVLSVLTKAEVTMTPEQIDGYLSRWEGLKNFDHTPGGFTPGEGSSLFRELFLKL